MKRDMELVRRILLQIEADADPLDIEEPPRRILEGHLELLVEAGLVNGRIARSGTGSLILLGTPKLSWDGHEFLDAARNNAIWEKAKRSLGDMMASIPLSVLKAYLTTLLRQELGIDL